MKAPTTRPVLWSIAGLDSGGGAGLSADQRAADAAGVHLCPVAAALTAQNTCSVESVMPVPAAQLEAQLAALAEDLPPAALKTGLLGGVEQLRVVARWIDRLRARRPLRVVVDPVLRASTGAPLADEALRRAFVHELLPRADVIMPNRHEAARLLSVPPDDADGTQPARARALRALGPGAVVVTGGDAAGSLALDRLLSPHAEGWLASPRRHAGSTHGTGCTFATALAAALARGFVTADAAVLAKMLTVSGLHARGDDPGAGPGPVRPASRFVRDPSLLPALFDGEVPPTAWPRPASGSPAIEGLYAITGDAAHAAALFAAGVRTVQLRMKRDADESRPTWERRLRAALEAAHAAGRRHGALLVVNDHWREAIDLGAPAVHLGQEDLLALRPEGRRRLAAARAKGLRLGISSHTPWELARAAAWAPDYVACGPVWPTTTKAMPWRAQGLGNLRWWVAVASVPVVAIGGVLEPQRMADIAAAGAAAGCVVRGIGPGSAFSVDQWRLAWSRAETEHVEARDAWPTPAYGPTLHGRLSPRHGVAQVP